MRQVAFFGIAPYEREMIAAFAPSDGEAYRTSAGLDPTSAAQVPQAEVISVFIYDRVTEAVLQQLPALRLVVTRSTGYDHVDLAACSRRGVLVANVPSYGENTVAEHAFALITALARRLPRAGRQTRELDFSLTGLEGIDLQGKTLGLVGAGRIGVCAARIGRGFGMTVLAFDPRENPQLAAREGFRYVPLADLLAAADIVSLHAALTPGTHHLIDRQALRRMKPTALLINTARGAIVDTEALCEALDQGWIAGAGLDVIEGEELIKDEAALLCRPVDPAKVRQLALCHALLRRDNVIITPHSAFFTREAVARLVGASLANIQAYLAGRPQNLVSPPAAPPRAA